MRRVALFALLAVVVHFPPVAAQAPALSARETAAVDAAVLGEMAAQKAVGVAVGVVRNGAVVYTQGYGYADRELKAPVSSKSHFRWASVSKPVTAIAAMQLVERGKLDLDADVRKYVPEFPDKACTITVRHLLCHQGGVVHYVNGKVVRTRREYDAENPFADVVLALDTFKESPLVCKPGEKYSYTTHGYILLSAAVERAGKERFADQVAARVVKPLGLTTLQPDYQWKAIPGRAVGYRKRGDDIVRSTDTDVSWKLGGGGFLSNVGDFARFAAGVMSHELVSAETAARMWEPQKLADGKPTTYGLGFQVGPAPGGRRRVMHTGSQEKTRTALVLYPDEKLGLVVMTNSEWANPVRFTDAVGKALAAAKAP
jgi:CubicO group peptidase (beta-lactamase class C family)